MSKFPIAKTFQLGGRTWTVTQPEQPGVLDEPHFGVEVFDLASIVVYKKHAGHDVPEEKRERTFMHEIVHAVLDEAQYADLSNDEAFVNRLSNGLHQVLTSLTFEEAKKK